MAEVMTRAQRLQKMSKAKKFGGGNNFRDGLYPRLAVKECCIEDKRGGKCFFIAKLVVMECKKVPVWGLLKDAALDVEPNPVGSTVDWMQEMNVEDHPGDGNIKDFVCKLFGVPMPEETDEEGTQEYLDTLGELCDLDEHGNSLPAVKRVQPGRGMVIAMETRRVVTKKKGKEITVQDWTSVAQTEDEKVAVCTWLDNVAKAVAAADKTKAA